MIPIYIKHPAVRVLPVTNKSDWLCGFFHCSFHELVKMNLAVKYSPSLKETSPEEFLGLFLNVKV